MPHLVFYDGVCGLCNRLVQFLLPRDRRDRFRFAALQGAAASRQLARFGRDPADLDTVCVLADEGLPSERLLSQGRAIVFLLEELGGGWSVARLARLVPASLLDRCYRFVARRRYRWFGRLDRCALPDPRHRSKFVE